MSQYQPSRSTQGKPAPVVEKPAGLSAPKPQMGTGEAFRQAAQAYRGSPTEFVAPKEVRVKNAEGAWEVKPLPGGSVFDRIPPEWQRQGGNYYPDERSPYPKNFDKLTVVEKWLYTKGLPWLSETQIGGMTISERLDKFNKSWVGRALPYFDVLAEGVERGFGMMSQLEDARRRGPTAYKEVMGNLGAAWRAGSLFYDSAGLPTMLVGPSGVQMEDSVMPGIGAMDKARRLIAQGYSTEDAKAAVYEDMGALMLRGQLQDTFMHIAADPANIVLGELKPITRLHAIREAALLESGRFTVAEVAIAKRAAVAAEQALEAAGESGRPLDLSSDLVRNALTTGATWAEMEGKAFSPAQRFAIWITGGMPFGAEAAKAFEKVAPKGKLHALGRLLRGDIEGAATDWGKFRFNPFELTPQARASEVLQLTSKLTENMIAGENDIETVLATLSRASSGALGSEVGHIMATPAGRNLQAYMKGASARVEDLATFYRANQGAITDIRAMADMVGEDVHGFMAGMQKDPAATWAKVQSALAAAPSDQTRMARTLVEEAIASRALGEKSMQELAAMFKEAPFSPETFKLYALNEVMDQVKEQAILQFGVHAAGFWQNAAEELKALETLAFLRLNPAYAVKNWWNNKITMVARGVYGNMPLDNIWAFWENDVGVIPPRLTSGLGAAEVSGVFKEGLGPAARVKVAYENAVADLGKAAASKPGLGKKIAERVSKLAGPMDAGKWAAKMESAASMQATTKAFIDLWPDMFGRMVDDMDKIVPGLSEALGPEVAGAVRSAIKGAYKGETLDAALLTRNLNANMETVIDEVARATGMTTDQIGDIFPRDFMSRLSNDLLPAMERGDPAEISQVFRAHRRLQERRIAEFAEADSLHAAERNLELMQVDGPQGYFRSWSEGYNREFGVHEAWINQLDREVPQIRALDNAGLRASAWRGLKQRGRVMFEQHQQWMSSHFGAMVDSARAHGLPFTDAIPNAVETRVASIRSFYEFRETKLENFFSGKVWDEATREAEWSKVKFEIDGEYRGLIDGETNLAKQIDDALEPLVPQASRDAFRAGRAEIRRLRERYMADMMDPAKRADPRLRITHQQAIYNAERRAEMAVMGDRLAQAELQPAQRVMTVVDSAKNKILAGIPLNDVEREALKQNLAGRVLTPKDDILRAEFGAFSDEALAARVDRLRTENMRPIEQLEKDYDALFRAEIRPGQTEMQKNVARTEIVRRWAEQNMPDQVAEFQRLSEAEKAVETGAEEFSATRQLRMRELNDAMEAGAREALRPNLDEALALWKGDEIDKPQLIQIIQENEGRAREIQRMTEWSLREQGLTTVRLFRRTDSPDSAGLRIRSWDSASASEQVAFEFGAHPGRVIEIEIPAENVFASYRTHPGLGRYSNFDRELEYLLNERGVTGGRIARIDGHVPNEQEMFFLREMYPEMWHAATVPEGGVSEFLPDARKMIPEASVPQGPGMAELWNSHGAGLFDQMETAAKTVAGRKALRFQDLDPGTQANLMKYLDYTKNRLPAVRMATMNMAEMKRDAALLNYTRRTRFDTLSGSIFPYSFWMTHSVYNWALWSLERPFVLAAYMRMRKLYDTAKSRPGWPSRMKGYGEVPLVQGVLGKMPFWENWMGPLYANPLGIGLPFEQWSYPFERAASDAANREARVQTILKSQLDTGEITKEQYAAALETKDGPEWEGANRQIEEGQDGIWDLTSALVAPHAPLVWAYNAARGKPFAPGPFLPATRTIKGVTAMMGVGPAGGVNIEAGIRKFMGLPEFDEWDDYRVDRMITNMIADGSIPVGVGMQALIDRAGPAFEEAKRRAGKEYAVRTLGGLAGIPITIFPPGEERARELYRQFGEAMEQYKAGNPGAVTAFFDEHPEAKGRLALFKSPEERLNSFLVDEIWQRYFSLPELHRRQVVDSLGPVFQDNFLNRETRNTENIDPETLSMWLAFMRGGTPGMLTGADPKMLRLAPAEDAQRMEAYYNTIATYFPADLWDTQKRYFMLEKGQARASYLKSHPALEKYWDWRRDFMYRNPGLAQYIEEDPEKWPKYRSEAALNEVLQQQPLYNWEEWTTALGGPTSRLVLDYVNGRPLSDAARRKINDVAAQLGMSPEELLRAVEDAAPR